MSKSKLIYTTVAGDELQYEPISTMALENATESIKKRYADEGKQITPPTYEVETAGGGVQVFEHDEETIKDNPEAQEAWAAYLHDMQEMNDEIGTLRNRMILSGVVFELPKDNAWMRKQKRWGMTLPTPPSEGADQDALDEYEDELRLHYLQTELLKTVTDAYGIVAKIMTASLQGALTPEALKAAEVQFLGTLPQAERELRTAGNTDGEASSLGA